MKKYNKIYYILSIIFIITIISSCNNTSNNNEKLSSKENLQTFNETLNEGSIQTVEETIEENSNEDLSQTANETLDETNDELENDQNNKNHNHIYDSLAYDVINIRQIIEDDNYEGEKIAFLTFDDGPNNTITPLILDTLKEKGVPATFFMPGYCINDNTKDILTRVYNEGHAIATHSYSHDYDILYPGKYPNCDKILEEELKVIDILRSYLGEHFNTSVFRYPGGHMSWNQDGIKECDKILEEHNIHWIDWNTMTGDAQPKDIEVLARPSTIDEVIENFNESKNYTINSDVSVILMHDASTKELTALALPRLIDTLKEQGYKFGILE